MSQGTEEISVRPDKLKNTDQSHGFPFSVCVNPITSCQRSRSVSDKPANIPFFSSTITLIAPEITPVSYPNRNPPIPSQ